MDHFEFSPRSIIIITGSRTKKVSGKSVIIIITFTCPTTVHSVENYRTALLVISFIAATVVHGDIFEYYKRFEQQEHHYRYELSKTRWRIAVVTTWQEQLFFCHKTLPNRPVFLSFMSSFSASVVC
jgi:hypothetical protein